jgi:hypothetical protein
MYNKQEVKYQQRLNSFQIRPQKLDAFYSREQMSVEDEDRWSQMKLESE